ncbi:unannotated protein [freshwater metagenome]|uniref:Unannotated protein n=1 Tax=freshwater metagenome TaxID=449393 RepID=A0A6J7WB03_9ZZZZ
MGMSQGVEKNEIVVYSDDSTVRASISAALGTQTSAGRHYIHEFATSAALRSYVDSGAMIDLFILDGEATPEGGMGIARQLKDELFNCPPVLVITGRVQDAWLAAWSMAEASLVHPIDPFTLAQSVSELLLKRSISHNL